jgi:hypothetical protein
MGGQTNIFDEEHSGWPESSHLVQSIYQNICERQPFKMSDT